MQKSRLNHNYGTLKDRHHILHERRLYEARPESKRLRETPSLVVTMDRRLHDEIHRNCPPVPMLGYYGLMATIAAFEPGRTPLESMDNLMFAYEQAGNRPKAHPLDRELAALAAQAVGLQRPFVQEGLLREQTIIDLGGVA